LRHAFARHQRDRGQAALRPSDRFRAGSNTKTFVAVTLLQLVDEGEVELDAPAPASLESDRFLIRAVPACRCERLVEVA